MNKYTLYIGLNDKETKRQQLDNLEASKIVQNILTEKTGGGSVKKLLMVLIAIVYFPIGVIMALSKNYK